MNTAEFLMCNADGDAEAFIEPGGRYTYADLRHEVIAKVERLADLALPVRSPVAIIGPNGFGWVSAYLATLAAGMVAVPTPNNLTPDEIAARLNWLGARAAFLGPREAGLITVDFPLPFGAERGEEQDGTSTLTPIAVEPGDDAVYAFTSGTTGRPRAVRHTHANIQANTEAIIEYLELTAAERVLAVLPFNYVFGASILHTHLRAGACIVIQPNAVFPQSMVERMATEQCTGFAGVPSTFHVLLRNSTFGSQRLPQLRTIQQAGGKLAPTLVRELLDAQPQAKVFVMYGQTEATARLSYLPPEELERRPGSIGRGIPGVTLRVVTSDGRPVSTGEVGEIWARGPSISPGYLNDPDETDRKMPRGELHTGDLATIDDEGFIYVVDRREDFIKSWGFRIASQDVESVVMQLSDLVEVAVVGVPDEAAGERLELVAVRRPGAQVTVEDVLRHCHARLAKHMVPSRIHFVPRLPLNANGKVSKTAVREFCLRSETAPTGRGDHEV